METGENLGKGLVQKLIEVQIQIEPFIKDATANAGKFSYQYITLTSLLEKVKPELNSRGLLLIQMHSTNEHGSFVATKIMNIGGDFIISETKVVCGKPNDPQAYGAAITYARRYGLQSLLALCAEDDDAKSAMPNKQTNNTHFT